jgi:hypothetical protein
MNGVFDVVSKIAIIGRGKSQSRIPQNPNVCVHTKRCRGMRSAPGEKSFTKDALIDNPRLFGLAVAFTFSFPLSFTYGAIKPRTDRAVLEI